MLVTQVSSHNGDSGGPMVTIAATSSRRRRLQGATTCGAANYRVYARVSFFDWIESFIAKK